MSERAANLILGTARSSNLAAQCTTFKSVYKMVSTPGFCTLITTSSPVVSLAA
jgi:hypothetical protein